MLYGVYTITIKCVLLLAEDQGVRGAVLEEASRVQGTKKRLSYGEGTYI